MKSALLLLTLYMAWQLRKRLAVASPDSLPISIHIGIPPGGSPVPTPPVSPLERMFASASEVSAGLLDLAHEMVSRVSSVTNMSEDLAVSESAASEFEVLQLHK